MVRERPLADTFDLISQQSTARPGCTLQLAPISTDVQVSVVGTVSAGDAASTGLSTDRAREIPPRTV